MSEVAPPTPTPSVARSRPQLDDASARATARASMAAGFPAPAQLIEQLGEAVIADIAAGLAAEAAEVVPAETAESSAETEES